MTRKPAPFSRRERQIMDALYACGRATAAEILERISDPPSNSALRTLLRILEEKGHVRHDEVGRVYHYMPTQPIESVRRSAVTHLLETFFDGSIESVVAAMLKVKRQRLGAEEAERIARMIEAAAGKGR